jgi:hypothetical protein
MDGARAALRARRRADDPERHTFEPEVVYGEREPGRVQLGDPALPQMRGSAGRPLSR